MPGELGGGRLFMAGNRGGRARRLCSLGARSSMKTDGVEASGVRQVGCAGRLEGSGNAVGGRSLTPDNGGGVGHPAAKYGVFKLMFTLIQSVRGQQ